MLDETTLNLPWYVNGSLDETMRADTARRVRSEPALRNELLFWEELAVVQSRSVPVAEDIALQRTLERILRDSKPKSAQAKAVTATGWFGRWRTQPGAWLKPALACALLVVIAQSVTLVQRNGSESAPMRGATSAVTTSAATLSADTALLRVVFDPATTEGEIRLLVAAQDAWIVGGPGVGGEYYLAVPQQRVIAATDALRAATAVRVVAGVDTLPQSR